MGKSTMLLNCPLAMFQNLMNARSQCSRFLVQGMDSTYFRSREIMCIKKKKKGIELYDSDIQANIIQKEDPCKLAGVQWC